VLVDVVVDAAVVVLSADGSGAGVVVVLVAVEVLGIRQMLCYSPIRVT